jgi:hypothetical protein
MFTVDDDRKKLGPRIPTGGRGNYIAVETETAQLS